MRAQPRDVLASVARRTARAAERWAPPVEPVPAGPEPEPVAVEPAAPAPPPTLPSVLDEYSTEPPSNQAAIDVFRHQWSSLMPAELGVTAGTVTLFEDTRIHRLLEWTGDVAGQQVLELGPLEGGHTWMLDRAGAHVLGIESNARAYLKCLVSKELLGMERARFWRGDFVAHLERDDLPRYDVVLASGVLYHVLDPVRLLERLARITDRVVIWTHYFDASLVAADSPFARQFESPPEIRETPAGPVTLHRRDYLEALGWGGFCGGPETWAAWMERDDLLTQVERLGFTDIEISHDDHEHPGGPALMLLARRP